MARLHRCRRLSGLVGGGDRGLRRRIRWPVARSDTPDRRADRAREGDPALPRFAAWGAVGGLLLGGLTAGIGMWGAAGVPVVGAFVVVAATALGAASAAGTLALARLTDDGELLQASADVADVGLTDAEARRLLGGAEG